MDNLHTIIYKGRDDAAYHPCTAQCTDNQQNDDGSGNSGNIIRNGEFVIFPGNPVKSYSYKYAESRSGQQGNLASSSQGIASECMYCGK